MVMILTSAMIKVMALLLIVGVGVGGQQWSAHLVAVLANSS